VDAMETILTRRSVRRYTKEVIAPETVTQLLEAAMSAPSAMNQQPWHFVVITDRATLNSIPEVHPYSRMVRDAPLAVIVCGDLNLDAAGGYWVQDCSAATENLLLAVRALGLGAVWCGIYPREERVQGLQKLLGIPEHVIPLNVISIGHPAEEQGRVERYDASRVHRDHW